MSEHVFPRRAFRLFVSGLSYSTDEETLKLHFSQFGGLEECRLMKMNGESRGFAFISFVSAEAVDKVCSSLHIVGGNKLRLERCVQTDSSLNIEDSMKSKQLFVSFIGQNEITDAHLHAHFSQFGTILQIELLADSGERPHCGLVSYRDEASVETAVEGIHIIRGEKLLVRKALRSEEVSKARQSEREEKARAERSRHAYAGFASTRSILQKIENERNILILDKEGLRLGFPMDILKDNRGMKKLNDNEEKDLTIFTRAFAATIPSTGRHDLFLILKEIVEMILGKAHTVNRRLAGSALVEHDDIVRDILARAGIKEGAVRKMVVKSDLFSHSSFVVCTRIHDDFVRLIPVCLDGGKSPHISFPYIVRLIQSNESVEISFEVEEGKTDTWFVNKWAPSVTKWAKGIIANLQEKAVNVDGPSRLRSVQTNRLVGVEAYSHTYRTVKEGMGRNIVQNWKDHTSAEKFVYEDCGIATYLSLLWKSLGIEVKKFVDVGCGNGLLVHILNELGFVGCGADLRARRIWATMFPQTSLIECTLYPSQPLGNGLPEGADFLIGNHSDELTPWIPVMAARLCIPFFLLPCCPFDFHGKLSKKHGVSQYDDMLQRVGTICKRLGYNVEVDRLAIPSTKRTALICTIPPEGLRDDLEEEIAKMTEESGKGRTFEPRPTQEKVRNCSGLERTLRDELTLRIFRVLLDKGGETNGWRSGGSLSLQEVVELLTESEKKAMKEQCGGVQTFLKNQHQIFKVVSGIVNIKDWRQEKRRLSSGKEHTSPCWFATHHPDGCPLSSTECTFKHPQ